MIYSRVFNKYLFQSLILFCLVFPYFHSSTMEASEVFLNDKPDLESHSTGCVTMEPPTPKQQSPTAMPGLLGFFAGFSCCVSSRKGFGTGARSRKQHHKGHIHGRMNPNVMLPPSSGTSSASMRSSPMLENWMSNFQDWRLVDIPVFPGTHHSGVNNPRKRTSQPVWGWAKCQDIGIEEQLHLGVRFLDLRIRIIPKSNEVLISHGLTSDTSLAEALEVVGFFLKGHPNETVLLYIRADKWHGIDPEAAALLASVLRASSIELFDQVDDGLDNLRVKHVAGKVLLIAPNETFAIKRDGQDEESCIPFINSECLQYCDIWQANSIDEAKTKIEAYMISDPPITGNSTFGGIALDGTFPIRQQSQTSRELNAWFIERLSTCTEWKNRIELKSFGIVLIDFADYDILTFLIGINNKLDLSNKSIK